jgi:hypothetical protein
LDFGQIGIDMRDAIDLNNLFHFTHHLIHPWNESSLQTREGPSIRTFARSHRSL